MLLGPVILCLDSVAVLLYNSILLAASDPVQAVYVLAHPTHELWKHELCDFFDRQIFLAHYFPVVSGFLSLVFNFFLIFC